MSQEALTLARDWAHPFTLAIALQFAAKLHHVRREAQATQERAEENIELSTKQGFTSFVAMETSCEAGHALNRGREKKARHR